MNRAVPFLHNRTSRRSVPILRAARCTLAAGAALVLGGCVTHVATPGSTLPGQAAYWNPQEAVRFHEDGGERVATPQTVTVRRDEAGAYRFPATGAGGRTPAPSRPDPVTGAYPAPARPGLALPLEASLTRARGAPAARVAANVEPRPERAALTLSPGDRMRVIVAEGDDFSGAFEVNADGHLTIPFLAPVRVARLTPVGAARAVERALVAAGMFRADSVRVTASVRQWAPVQVSVAGAVFNPGRVLINNRDPELRAQLTQDGGDFAPERYLSAALRAAGGVRPDAALASVVVIRDATSQVVDLTGAIDGAWFDDVVLGAGDQVVVPSAGRFQNALVRPSAVTAPGVRVFMSNLTTPADNNSKSAIGTDATRLPYGMRFLQGLAAANCVGGTRPTNAARHAVLITTNPTTLETQVIERSVEELVRGAERDAFNPYLMPNDAIACYDSGVTSLRDIARGLGEVLSPFSALLGLL